MKYKMFVLFIIVILSSCFDKIQNVTFINPISDYKSAITDKKLYGLWLFDNINNKKNNNIDEFKCYLEIIPSEDIDNRLISISLLYIYSLDNDLYEKKYFQGYISSIENNNYFNIRKYEYNETIDEKTNFNEKGAYELNSTYNIVKYKIINDKTLDIYLFNYQELIKTIKANKINGKFMEEQKLLDDKMFDKIVENVDGVYDSNLFPKIIIFSKGDKLINFLKNIIKNDNYLIFRFKKL